MRFHLRYVCITRHFFVVCCNEKENLLALGFLSTRLEYDLDSLLQGYIYLAVAVLFFGDNQQKTINPTNQTLLEIIQLRPLKHLATDHNLGYDIEFGTA